MNVVTANGNIPWGYLSERPVTVWLICYIGIIFNVLEIKFNKRNFQKTPSKAGRREQIKIGIISYIQKI